jgi:hypothetical protein
VNHKVTINLLSVSIPIALALLLSAASAEQPSPRPTTDRSTPLAEKRNNYTAQTKTNSVQPSPTLESTSSEPTARSQDEKNAAREHRQNSSGEPSKESQPRDWLQIFFNFWLTIATIALAIFTWKLVGVTRDVHKATVKGTEVANENVKAAKASAEAAKAQLEFTKTANQQNIQIAAEAAEAAKQSARAADLALHIDRPFLVADRFKFVDDSLKTVAKIFTSERGKAYAIANHVIRPTVVPVTFTLTNYGKGPAVIQRILGRIAVVQSFDEVPYDDFSECEEWRINRQVFGVGEEETVSSSILALLGMTNPKAGSLTPEEQRAIVDSQAVLIVYGQIAYSDLFDAQFFLDFFWIYSTLNLGGNGFGLAISGPKERNQHRR